MPPEKAKNEGVYLLPLYIAVEAGDLDRVKSLIAEGANVNVGTADTDTPLHCATRLIADTDEGYAKCESIIKELVDAGADLSFEVHGLLPSASAEHYQGGGEIMEYLESEQIKAGVAKSDPVEALPFAPAPSTFRSFSGRLKPDGIPAKKSQGK